MVDFVLGGELVQQEMLVVRKMILGWDFCLACRAMVDASEGVLWFVMARKNDGSLRFCTDFRGLNSVTVTEAHPLPQVDVAVDQLSGSVFFSCLDLSSGYWQVELDPEDREKTAFSVGKRLWQYKDMVMGLKNAPPTFQRLVDLALQGIDWQHVLVYIKDICLLSPSFEHHLVLLRDVFTKLRVADLRLKPSRCQLFQRSVVFLGQKVSDRGIQPDPANLEKVAGNSQS